MENQTTRHHGLVGPVILISLGVLFLLNNLGLMSWTVWEVLLRLWPIFLVGIGLDLLFGRRSLLGSLLVVVIMVGMLVGGVYWMNAQASSGQVLPQESFSQPLQGAEAADVTIRFGTGTLRIDGAAAAPNLADGSLATSPGERVRRSFELEGGRADLTLASEGAYPIPSLWGNQNYKVWDVHLNPTIPTSLTVNAGVGTLTLDLRRLKLERLDYNMGISQSSLTLPANGVYRADVASGIGQLTITVPEGVAARVRIDGWLGGTNVTGQYTRSGDVYTTPGYDSAANRVELEVHGGIGSVRIDLP